MVKFLLSFVPWQTVLPWIVSKLTNLSQGLIDRAIDLAFSKVVEVENKYGSKSGAKKAKEVKESIKNAFSEIPEFAINLLVEVAVAKAKKLGFIK